MCVGIEESFDTTFNININNIIGEGGVLCPAPQRMRRQNRPQRKGLRIRLLRHSVTEEINPDQRERERDYRQLCQKHLINLLELNISTNILNLIRLQFADSQSKAKTKTNFKFNQKPKITKKAFDFKNLFRQKRTRCT